MKKIQQLSFFPSCILLLVVLWGLGDLLLAQSSYKEIEVANGGSIHGSVRLAGTCPSSGKFEVTKDKTCCGINKPSPRLVVGKNNGIKNAIVYLDKINEGKKFRTEEKAVLNQKGCEYNPHVLILQLGKNLEISNSDPVLHNVHAYSMQSSPQSMFNIAQPIKGQKTAVKQNQMNRCGIVQATCDAGHPWMSAYIMVTEHPYVAITNEKGEFELENIPPGTYLLKMWHEGVAVTHTEMENGKAKKYYYEESYEDLKEVALTSQKNIEVNFDISLR